MRRGSCDRALVWAAVVGLCAFMSVSVCGCASGNDSGGSAESDDDPVLRMVPDRVFDGERPFIRGNPVGVELHWWLTQDSDGVVARALAPYDQDLEFLPEELRERLRLSGVRIVAVPLSEIVVVHQVAAPASAWSRRWLGQSADWLQIMRSRRVAEGTRGVVYGSEQRLPEGVLRLLGRAWIVPERVEGEEGTSIGALMRLELVAQVQQRDPRVDHENHFEIPNLNLVTPALEGQGPLLEELMVGLTVPPGYAIVMTTASPEADWSSVEGVTRENLLDELQRRETEEAGESVVEGVGEGGAPRFGPSAAPGDVPMDAENEETQVFETLDAPMPSLANSYGPRAAPLPTVGQLMLESRDRLSRPLRGVVILIPRLPDEFRLLP
ncbi:MAG: hypothetical protein ACF8MJ_12030 [Phycisphaerales bacterium JB050]